MYKRQVDDLTNFEKISSRFFARELDIDYRALIKSGFIEDDTQLLMRVYWNQVIPDIEITKVFGDPMGYGTQFGKGNYGMGIKQIYDDYTAAIKEVGENTKEGIALAKTRDKILDDLDVSIGLIRGTYGLAKDPNRSLSRAIRMGKLYNSMTMLTGIAQVVDTARLVMINGVGRTFKLSWEVFTSGMSKEVFNMSKKSAQLGGEAFDMYNSSRAMSMYDVGDAFGVFNQFERVFVGNSLTVRLINGNANFAGTLTNAGTLKVEPPTAPANDARLFSAESINLLKVIAKSLFDGIKFEANSGNDSDILFPKLLNSSVRVCGFTL